MICDNTTRLAYEESLNDESVTTAISFLSRAVARFNGQRREYRQVMRNKSSIYISKAFTRACSVVKHKRPGQKYFAQT